MKEIIINVDANQNKRILLVENGKLLEQYEENSNMKRLEGNIYLGKIQNVLQGMQAAFVDIGEKKNTFIHIKDILPKVDTKVKDPEEAVKNNNIKDIVKVGMPILVQVKRDSTNKKGARVSTHINLAGRFCVIMPGVKFITISQKIEKEKERTRLIEMIEQHLPEGVGIIVRTSAEGKKEEDIIRDMKQTLEKWKNIQKEAKQETQLPKLVCENSDMVKRILVDLIDQDITRIIVNTQKEKQEIEQMLKENGQQIEIVLQKQESILDRYDLQTQLEKIENRKIWLKCGGFITIDKTEALTAIDVNSGKYIGTKSLEQTVYTVNKEASIEIAKQLRLRDIGGIIIIDYIDMKEKEHKEKIIQVLQENLKQDRSKTQIVGFTELNLLEMTRKHMCSND
ncbi:MAG: Rne/Rng family ribonuclease [Clostridia bacterium]|nr:Rne/Rng family ribonuclease [Clostridia bacterium]